MMRYKYNPAARAASKKSTQAKKRNLGPVTEPEPEPPYQAGDMVYLKHWRGPLGVVLRVQAGRVFVRWGTQSSIATRDPEALTLATAADEGAEPDENEEEHRDENQTG